jgi:hypothetical protein
VQLNKNVTEGKFMGSAFHSNLQMIFSITMMIVAAAYLYVTFINKEKYEDKTKEYRLHFTILILILLIVQQILKNT